MTKEKMQYLLCGKKKTFYMETVWRDMGMQCPKMKRHCEVLAWCICTVHCMQREKKNSMTF